jgi:uncharacterized protein YwgA
MSTPVDVKDIVADAGGEIVGKTRLQKTAYFLEASNVGSGFDFSYHYYGPYSEELATATNDADALGMISIKWDLSSAGFEFATYRSVVPSAAQGKLAVRRREILGILGRYDTVSLELAATAHFLAANGFAHNAWEETKKRKAGKATDGRIQTAKQLLGELGF